MRVQRSQATLLTIDLNKLVEHWSATRVEKQMISWSVAGLVCNGARSPRHDDSHVAMYYAVSPYRPVATGGLATWFKTTNVLASEFGCDCIYLLMNKISISHVRVLIQVRDNIANSNKEEVRELRWKAHDAAQMVTALRIRKVSAAWDSCNEHLQRRIRFRNKKKGNMWSL